MGEEPFYSHDIGREAGKAFEKKLLSVIAK